MALEQLIKESFSKDFDKYIYNELIIGQMAHTALKTGVNKGDEINVQMPVSVTLQDYAGGDIGAAEKTDTSFVKVRLDKGHYVHFRIDEVRKKLIENSPATAAADLVKEFKEDAAKQFAAALDRRYGELFTRAGFVGQTATGGNLAITELNAKKLFGHMAMMFQRGDGKGHNSWLPGKMIAVVPPEYQYVLGQIEDLKYTESGQRKVEKGYIGRLAGWDIVVSNNIASQEGEDGKTVYYPLFGIKGRTLAGGASKDLGLQSYVPDLSFDTCFKGWGYMGTGAPRPDMLGTAKITIDTALS